MKELIDELKKIWVELQKFCQKWEKPSISQPLSKLEKAADEVGKAWSGSWIGYQSRIYYENLNPPPPGAHFSIEWGPRTAIDFDTTGNWKEFDFDDVRSEIFRKAKNPDLAAQKKLQMQGQKLFEEKRKQIISILETVSLSHEDRYISELLKEVHETRIVTASDFIQRRRPSQLMSRDSLAMSQGLQIPPHIALQAELISFRTVPLCCEILGKITKNGFLHLERILRQKGTAKHAGRNVFIGHGRSSVWKDLRDFIHDRLHLQWDEFNRVSVAGVSTVDRLVEMLNDAAIAFLILTAEDEQADGQMRARENVVHEAGLFQGRLGFTKAIVLLEEGCQEFSNIHGLGQIRFPKGNITAAFEEIRRVMEREGLIKIEKTEDKKKP